MSQDVAVHHQDAGDVTNEVAHDQVQTHRRRESMTSEATQTTQAVKANASTNLSTPPSSNDNEVDHNPLPLHLESSEEAVSGKKHAVARVISNPAPNDSSNLQHAVNGTSEANQGMIPPNMSSRVSCIFLVEENADFNK
jgi:hypothetical protein